jgi:poly(A) polymerase
MPPARLFEEVIKLFTGGAALQSFEQLRHYDLFKILFPQTDEVLAEQEGGFPHTLLIHALRNTDTRIAEDKPVTPGFLLAALLWAPMNNAVKGYMESGLSELEAITLASDVVISRQVSRTAMPRRFSQMARDIWQLQIRLKRTQGNRPARLFRHPKFRAGYDFLLLRAAADDSVKPLADWWTDFVSKQQVEQPDPVFRTRRRGRGGNRHRPPKNRHP